MTGEERAELRNWCRFAAINDQDEDGVCEFTLKFKIRGTDMQKVYSSMNYGDAVQVASDILSRVCDGCECFWEDWLDPDNEAFAMDYWLADGDGFIIMRGNYRT